MTAAQVPPDVAAQFPGDRATDDRPAGGGYIHAPSISACRYRGGLAQRLSRQRRRAQSRHAWPSISPPIACELALTLIEGIRNGQSLGALLGYRFERGLHDDLRSPKSTSSSIRFARRSRWWLMQCRRQRPNPTFRSKRSKPATCSTARSWWTACERNGNRHATRFTRTGLSAMPAPILNQQQALDAETSALLDTYDALADLALAEGVYQAVQGNYDRVASTIDAYTTGNFPPEPQVVQTPPDGVDLTHRVCGAVQAGAGRPAGATPRAQAEPAIDEWLGDVRCRL